jgi:hypothetical protein
MGKARGDDSQARGRFQRSAVTLLLLCSATAASLWVPAPLAFFGEPAQAQGAAPEIKPQTILLPGLYLFQTRTREGTCNDAPRTGYVTSAVATLDGVPGSRLMTMQLLNSKYWPTWTLTVNEQNLIVGSAILGGGKDESAGTSRFEISPKKDRFQGVGTRTYPSKVGGETVSCTLSYDALLKPLDD